MSKLRPSRPLLLLLITASVIVVAMTAYTWSGSSSGSALGVRRLIRQTLDGAAASPALPTFTTIPTAGTDTAPGSAAPFPGPRTTYAPAAVAWAEAAARADSGALRSWLGRGVWTSVSAQGAGVHLTMRRFLPGGGCPAFATLRATSVRHPDSREEILSVSASCPSLASR